MSTRNFGLLGVPTSAGAHMPGQEKAPEALRIAGLVEKLAKQVGPIFDYGDLYPVRQTPDKISRNCQNYQKVVEVANNVAARLDPILQDKRIPLVIGGDCTIEIGVLTAFQRAKVDVGLLYFDAHFDLNSPTNSVSGAMDSMGMAHILGESGSFPELNGIGPHFPILKENKVVFFSYVPAEINDAEQKILDRNSLSAYPVELVSSDPEKFASIALEDIESRCTHFVLHFDVDVMNFIDFPLANIPTFNGGLSFQDAMTCLHIFAGSSKFAGLVITEINPNHTDENGLIIGTFIQGLANALTLEKTVLTN